MSYDISLYDRAFLKRALDSNLGDWTRADPIPQDAKRAIIEAARSAGFVLVPLDAAFAAFVREQGSEPGQEFLLDNSSLLAQLTIHLGQVAFTIPYSPRAEASIAACRDLARRLASETGLAFYDPQEGESDV
jgi:hypothetical protein